MKPIYAHLGGALALSFTIAACVPAPDSTPAPEPAATPAPRPAPPPPPPPPVYDSWMDVPATPGDWSYGATTTGSQALFGDSFALGCSAGTRQVTLTRLGAAAATPSALIIRTESATRSLAAQPSGDRASVGASLTARDPLLDAMALTKGRFAVEAAGLPTLYLPAWGEVTRVIEDCR